MSSEPVARSFKQRTFGALRYPHYRWLLIGAFVSQSGSWLHGTVAGLYVATVTRDQFYVSLAGFLNFAPALVFGLVGGALADRYDRRRLLVLMQWVELGLTALLAVLFAVGLGSIWVIFVTTLGLGVIIALNGPAWFSFYPTLVPPDDLPSAISLNAIQFNVARIFGPWVGGFLLVVGPAFVFALNSLSFLAFLAPLMFIRFPDHSPAKAAAGRSGGGVADLAAAFRYVRQRRWLSVMLLTMVVQALFAAQVITLLPAFGRLDLGYGYARSAWLFSAFGAGGLVGALAASNAVGRVPRERLVPGLVALIGLALMLLSTQRSFPLVLACLALVGVVYIGMLTSLNALVQLGVDDEVRGRVSSMWFTIFVGLFPPAGLVWGALVKPASRTYLVGGLVCAAYAVVLLARPGLLRDATPENRG